MSAAAYFCFCLVFGTFILCDGRLKKRQILSVCSVDTFNCTSGSCIDSSLICDGRKDCSDGSDETQSLCSDQTCPNYAFQCQYGACVPKIAKCNGKNDCADGSDEKLIECLKGSSSSVQPKPNCQPDEYRCKSGQCIDGASTCDGTRDCSDGTDETLLLCKSISCPNYSFKCKYGACISYSSRCDGVRQCIDGSDENHECTAATPKPKPTTASHAPPPTVPPSTNSGRKTCVLPTTEGSIYKYYDSNSNAVLPAGTKVTENSIIAESCEKQYYQNGSSRYIVCTKTGHWQQTNSDKLCLKMCPPMTSDTLDITCTLKGEDVDCSKPSIPGTKLKPKCKVTHYLETGQERPTEHTCLTDGKWSGTLYTCVPHCGRLTYTKAEPQILKGTKVKYGTAPWNVAIYETQNNSLICGGTLISPNLVVSAAHCFFNGEVTPDSRTRLLESENAYKIAVGKYDRNISILDNDFTQIIDVGKVHVRDNYHGLTGNYDEDLAVIWLPTKVKISSVVAPACVDWTGKYIVQSGSPGKIVGWGNTEQMVPSSYLLEASMTYINQTECRKMYISNFSVSGFQNFVTNDKFCANSESGQGVDKGDSGAGLTFPFNKLHHLFGVVSLKDTSIPGSTTAVFTDVSLHINWLSDIYLNYSN